MTLFLTSSPSGCPFEPGPAIPVLDRRNHFLENLRAVWPDHPVQGLAIAADPHAYAQNDEMCRVFAQSFANAHLPLTALIPCDARNAEEIGSLLPQSGFVMLCGGHVPTQNHFFAQLGLPGLFHNYHGIVLGVSAGSMNAARLVYAAPEEPGEAADPGYCRWLNGLGLTETRILPHYQFIREHILDGQRMEDIALADSRKRHFLALPDGSYLMCSDGHEALYGKAWYFADGTLEEINEDEDVLPLCDACIEEMRALARCWRALWMNSLRPFGFEVIDIRLSAQIGRLETARERIGAFAQGRLDDIPELTEEKLPYLKRTDGTLANLNIWSACVSPTNVSWSF